MQERFSNKNMDPLSDKEIMRLCPAVFAEAAHPDVSSRYGYVSSKDILGTMRENGFVPTQVNAYHRRSEEAREFTKHMIRFRPDGELRRIKKGDVVPQIVIINSHDRSSQFQLYGGLWRLVCENGLMVAEGAKVEPLIVRHTTSAVDGLLDATGKLIKQQKYVFEVVDEMSKIQLTEKQAVDFATRSLATRPERAGVIDPRELLAARRTEDQPNDLWHVFNRVQENLMKGGLKGITANNRAVVTRGVTSINADIAVNAGMWRVAVEAIERARKSSAATTKVTKERRAPGGRRASDVKPLPANPAEIAAQQTGA